MNNDLVMTLSAKIERLYNKMIASEAKGNKSESELKTELQSLKFEVQRTNDILEKIYLAIKK